MAQAADANRLLAILAAYDRACRAASIVREPPLLPPVLQLSEAAARAVFAPASYENLVTRPLAPASAGAL
jgi:hypothetical protein